MYAPLFFFSIWVLWPVKFISLILNLVKLKLGRKWEIPEKNHLSTRKQNLASLTWDLSSAQTHSGEMTSDLEHKRLAYLTTLPRGLGICSIKPLLFADVISTLFTWSSSSEPQHDKTSKITCAPDKDSDQPGPSLRWEYRSFCWILLCCDYIVLTFNIEQLLTTVNIQESFYILRILQHF